MKYDTFCGKRTNRKYHKNIPLLFSYIFVQLSTIMKDELSGCFYNAENICKAEQNILSNN